MQLGMKRAAIAAAGVILLGVLPASAAEVTITDAKVVGGKLVVSGTTATANMNLMLDGSFPAKSNAAKAFSFNIVYRPADCIVEVGKTGALAVTKAVVANCGPGGVRPLGAWSGTRKYIEDDVVTSDGSSWRAKRGNINKPPAASAQDWEKFASKGDMGLQGDTGIQGNLGATGPAGPAGSAGPAGPAGSAGPAGPGGSAGSAGPIGPTGPQGQPGANGLQGNTGMQGVAGSAGVSNIVASFYTDGGVTVTSLSDSIGAFSFFASNGTGSTFVSAVAVGANQVVLVDATVALGTTIASGATLDRLSICRRITGSMDAPVDYILGISIKQNMRVPLTLSSRFSGLAAGNYEFGLCYQTTSGQGATWNSNDWTRTRVIVANE